MKQSKGSDIDASQRNESVEILSSTLGEWIGYWESPTAGSNELLLPEQYVVLIVLKGEIMLTFNTYDKKTIGKSSLVMLDRHQLTHFKWAADTALLEFTPPTKIFRFFASCSSVFHIPCSATVPVQPNLQRWIDDLMAERLLPKEMLTDVRRRDFCVRLGNILRSYPPLVVGELLVPFHACSLSGEKRCKGELCE